MGCAVHEAKPVLCAEYPYSRAHYRDKQRGIYHANAQENPGVFRGCGFNLSPLAGISEAEILAALVPLAASEL